jgi:XTP/dITP diphosphohydrolase
MNTDNTVLFATSNHDKYQELRDLLDEFLEKVWDVYDLAEWPEQTPDVDEDRPTFHGNAVKKALEVSEHTGSVTIADDSGLEVDALDGRPGVRSARYAGPNATDEDNNEKLIEELKEADQRDSTARFVSVLALALPANNLGRKLLYRVGIPYQEIGEAEPDKEGQLTGIDNRVVVWFRGEVEGRIIEEARGEHGFGYDPHFYVPKLGKTMAEVPVEDKNQVSHRAAAAEKVTQFFTL